MKVEIWQPPMAQPEGMRKGKLSLFYGKSGVGKTATILQTAQDPIFYIMAEGRSIDSTIGVINRPNIRLAIGYYSNWNELMALMYNLENFKKFYTVFGDSMSHIMNIHLPDEILEENFDARDKEKSVKELTNRVKGTPEMYGALSKQMARLMKASQELCINGHDVIWSARDQEFPKWNTDLACGPALAGKEFPRDVKGFFDFIGMVESRYDETGKVVYPPQVSCDDRGNYLSKWTGFKPPTGVVGLPFNVAKMLKYAETGGVPS